MFDIKSRVDEISSKIRSVLKIAKPESPEPSLPGIDKKPPESYFSLSDARSKLKLFPERYREYFDPDVHIDDGNLFIGRDDERAGLKNAFSLWREGNPCSVAVIGHSGHGKTTLIDFFRNEVSKEVPVEKVALGKRLTTTGDVLLLFQELLGIEPPPPTVQELADAINGMPGRVVLIENFHLAFLRAMSCHEAIKAFLYLIMSTGRNWMWVVSVDYYPWLKMEYLYSLSTYFTCDVTISRIEKDHFKEIFLTRQEASGYELSTDLAEKQESEGLEHVEAAALDPEAQQAALLEEYLDDLYDLSGGNLQSALVYWLLSVSCDEERKSVQILPVEEPDFSFLTKLERMHIFTLAEIVNHGGLSAEEHGLVFGIERFESLLVLEFLRNKKVLEKGEGNEMGSDARYWVNPIFSLPVTSMLQDKNILY